MPARPTFDAFRLARKGETLQGDAAMADLPRLAQSVLDPQAEVHYEVTGRVEQDGHAGAVMSLSAVLRLRCERCNRPLSFVLKREVPFRFIADEQELNALPIEDDELEEVLGSPAMELFSWIEDEAILSLPLVPSHADCAVPLPPLASDAEETVRPNPFAALARLKKTSDGEDGDGGAGPS